VGEEKLINTLKVLVHPFDQLHGVGIDRIARCNALGYEFSEHFSRVHPT
jgi:hypothetical protein